MERRFRATKSVLFGSNNATSSSSSSSVTADAAAASTTSTSTTSDYDERHHGPNDLYMTVCAGGVAEIKYDRLLRDVTQIVDNARAYHPVVVVSSSSSSLSPTLEQSSVAEEAERMLQECRAVLASSEKRVTSTQVVQRRKDRLAMLREKNREPCVQGQWHKMPYPKREYHAISAYRPADGLSPQEAARVMHKLRTTMTRAGFVAAIDQEDTALEAACEKVQAAAAAAAAAAAKDAANKNRKKKAPVTPAPAAAAAAAGGGRGGGGGGGGGSFPAGGGTDDARAGADGGGGGGSSGANGSACDSTSAGNGTSASASASTSATGESTSVAAPPTPAQLDLQRVCQERQQVRWHNLQADNGDIIERDTWGIDCYARKSIELSLALVPAPLTMTRGSSAFWRSFDSRPSQAHKAVVRLGRTLARVAN
jgi:hypothetical protein